MDNLLEQFEANDPLRMDLTSNGNTDPRRASQIVAAVKSHFSTSSRTFPPGSVPKIGTLETHCSHSGHSFLLAV